MKNYNPYDRTFLIPRLKSFTLTAFLALSLIGCSSNSGPGELEESKQALSYWQQAHDYQAQGRFALARQQYLLALAASRTSDVQVLLQRDLFVVDRMLQVMR